MVESTKEIKKLQINPTIILYYQRLDVILTEHIQNHRFTLFFESCIPFEHLHKNMKAWCIVGFFGMSAFYNPSVRTNYTV
ncbi:hypothetical protein BC351_07320 [Paenibacillus ferrarius]|uniref:Uncharacterized protein n=1 Tax=Paenibacillus ferrarius TaxID=1469647 RepID=A0A1V4HBY3_9BACL|nr:hypothetical protein BC351_07320 [Paenibacillus ferrarius]